MNAQQATSNSAARWLPAAAAGGLVAAVVAAGVISGSGGDPSTSTLTSDSVSTFAGAATTTPAATLPPESYTAVEESTETVTKVPLSQSLATGAWGDEVELVQRRLAELAFDPGPIDGQFGNLTKQAVWAFEKLIMGVPRSEATGVVTPEMWDRMQDPITVTPRRPTGGLADHTEVYLPEQTMVVFHGDEPALVAHISTGELAAGATGFTPWYETADEYCETITVDTDRNGVPLEEPEEKAICGRSYTPPGVFKAYRKVEGQRLGPLGGMMNPIYINQGIAIHGADNVPLTPASHGCIRVSQYLGSSMQDILELGDRVLIWDGVTEPENQSEEATKMRWDYADPNATTTTTSTTTTTTTLPEAPPTTTEPAPAPVTTTTVAPTTTTTTTEPPPPETTTTTVFDGDDGDDGDD
ncbi:L,D-transpeptidase family protein [Ilumatobacter sp.]|uniref:L,D-transpeptidase family protein n=1 Tax=Ilumatobacter sp. TaxID=1967498 RepID=UPI003AF8BF70